MFMYCTRLSALESYKGEYLSLTLFLKQVGTQAWQIFL